MVGRKAWARAGAGDFTGSYVIIWFPFLEFTAVLGRWLSSATPLFTAIPRGFQYKVTILNLAAFNSPPPLFFFGLYFAPISYLLYMRVESDLFYLALWIVLGLKSSVLIRHFKASPTIFLFFPLSGGLRRKDTGKPYHDGMVVHGLLRMAPDGVRIWENHVKLTACRLRAAAPLLLPPFGPHVTG